MTDLTDIYLSSRKLNESTAFGLDYTPDELDDLTSRKVEAVEFDGDALARIVRARRGTARYQGMADPYAHTTDAATVNLWPRATASGNGNRRMAAVGRKHAGLGQALHLWDDEGPAAI